MRVLKFGGTSVGSASAIRQLGQIVTESSQSTRVVIVVSAMSGVTNTLLAAAKAASQGDLGYQKAVEDLASRIFDTATALLSPVAQSANYGQLRILLNQLEDVLQGISLLGECTSRSLDLVASFGERLSAQFIANYLTQLGHPAEMIDARSFIVTDAQFTKAVPDLPSTYQNIQSWHANQKAIPVVTGFIAATPDGVTTTLGRGGSDFTAAIFGAALSASVIEIWTDVDGMLTADPRRVKKAFTQPEVSYQEAMELSHFGAKVIYPPTLLPAIQQHIPIRIANTFNHQNAGTLIHAGAQPGERPVRGVTCIESIALLTITGGAFVGVAGMAARVFDALASRQINIILISQASSEQNICIAISPEDGSQAVQAIASEFDREIERGLIDQPTVNDQFSIIAVIGDGMRTYAGLSGKLFKTLGNNGINVVAAAQGSSELNISVVVERKDLNKGLNALHDTFFLNLDRTINLFLAGPGLIGSNLLEQIHQQTDYLASRLNLKIKLVGLINSRQMLMEPDGIDLNQWKTVLQQAKETANPTDFVQRAIALNLPNSVLADCTAGTAFTNLYAALLKASIGVVTPNKIANSGPLDVYLNLKHLAVRYNAPFLYETNVGAGLPIINTLQGLVQSGDPILKIEAVLSGTLSFIFNTFGSKVPFYEAVKLAQEAGYTEPDPRDDLSGLDMARKVLILAREMGLNLEAHQVAITPILPEVCAEASSVAAFYAALKAENQFFSTLAAKAEQEGQKLRYIATIQEGKASISLQTVTPDNPFFNLNGSENMVVFTTFRYNKTPLVVKGPGAGAAVTAAGVFADVLRCARD